VLVQLVTGGQVMPGKESIAQLVIRLRHVMSGFANLVQVILGSAILGKVRTGLIWLGHFKPC
jgi:hypothetical protein